MEVKQEIKKYSREHPFVYENGYFHDYFRVMPFARLKSLLDKSGVTLDGASLMIASCGCGIDAYYLTKYYKPASMCFTDISERALEKARSVFYAHTFAIENNECLSFEDNSFDYVFIAAALHHLKEPNRGVSELLRVARRGLIVIEPNDTWLTRLFERLGLAHQYEVEHGNYVYRYSKRDVEKTAKALFFKYAIDRFFATHRVAKTKLEFIMLKALNAICNVLFPELGNYIMFVIQKEKQWPKEFLEYSKKTGKQL
jgi:ubiquinone/menaquinone biosynthesis C-methylase UbiE